jgi:hypothetical protein
MVKRNNQRKTQKKARLNKSDKLIFNRGDFLLRAHGNKKTKRNKKIIDIPFSKYKSKGTKATLGNMGFNYQEYRNIGLFFHNTKEDFKKDLNYSNLILGLVAKKNKVYIRNIPKIHINKKFNILIVNLNTEEGNHANIALINNINKTIEYFEPHGYRKNKQSEIAGIKGIYKKKIKVLKNLFSEILPSHSFVDVVYMNKKTSFQTELDPDENSGFCVMWCILFVHYRLLNQDVLLSRLLKHMDKVMTTNKLLKYAKHVEDTIKQKI